MGAETLKLCPFCGGEARLMDAHAPVGGMTWRVICPCVLWSRSPEEAAAIWNRRAVAPVSPPAEPRLPTLEDTYAVVGRCRSINGRGTQCWWSKGHAGEHHYGDPPECPECGMADPHHDGCPRYGAPPAEQTATTPPRPVGWVVQWRQKGDPDWQLVSTIIEHPDVAKEKADGIPVGETRVMEVVYRGAPSEQPERRIQGELRAFVERVAYRSDVDLAFDVLDGLKREAARLLDRIHDVAVPVGPEEER